MLLYAALWLVTLRVFLWTLTQTVLAFNRLLKAAIETRVLLRKLTRKTTNRRRPKA